MPIIQKRLTTISHYKQCKNTHNNIEINSCTTSIVECYHRNICIEFRIINSQRVLMDDTDGSNNNKEHHTASFRMHVYAELCVGCFACCCCCFMAIFFFFCAVKDFHLRQHITKQQQQQKIEKRRTDWMEDEWKSWERKKSIIWLVGQFKYINRLIHSMCLWSVVYCEGKQKIK